MPVAVDLSKLSYVVKNDVVKKTVYDKLVAKGIDTSVFVLIVPVAVDLSKLSYVVKNDVVKKTVYDKLVAKVIDTSVFVLKTKYDTDKSQIEKKIPDTSGLLK